MVRIGIVGMGFMGYIHFLAAQRLEGGGRVAAIVSRDPAKRLGDWRSIRGNFGPPGAIVPLGSIKAYATLEELLADPEIDLVDICLPTDQHVAAARAALAAGKHVLVEKPLALHPDECHALLAEAKAADKLLMVAQVLPYFPEFRFAHDFVHSGTAGAIRAAHFRRLISRPDWSESLADSARTGGPAIDLHIHDTHFLYLLWGLPRSVLTQGVWDGPTLVYQTTHYEFAEGGCVTSQCGAICPKGRPFVHGFEIHGSKAALIYDSGGQALTLLDEAGEARPLQFPAGGG
ncbi:MAG TPA: Gfo/Idh/MocA family oxidoreductase, partial [Gemmatales bacterium]|nr:Gfo/Idh/MocA family oxidoreductase [Gemmatales bacterium]